MIPLVERQESFAGGMNALAAPVEFRPDELSYVLNGLLDQEGVTLRPRAGSQRTHATALNSGAQVWGATEFYLANGTQHLVVFAGDSMYYSTDEGVNWTLGASGLGTDYWDTAVMRVGTANRLICANGSTSLYYWDGSTWGTLAGAPSGVKYVAVFNDRLYVAGHDGDRVAASAVGDPTGWTLPAAFEVQVQTHDGDVDITGLFSTSGILLAFKRKSTAYIDGFGYTTLQVQSDARGISRSSGCVAFRTIAAVSDEAVCWLSERGVEWYQPGGRIALLSSKVQPTIDSLAWEEMVTSPGIAHAAYLDRENEYRVAVPVSGVTTGVVIGVRPPRANSQFTVACWLEDHPDGDVAAPSDTVFISGGYLEFNSGPSQSLVTVDVNGYLTVPLVGTEYVELSGGYLSLAGASGSQHAAFFIADAIGDAETSRLWAGGYDGFVRRMKVGTKDDVASDGTGGNDVTMTVRTRPLFFGEQFRPKKARTLRILTAQPSAAAMSARLYVDGTPTAAKAVTGSATAGASAARTRFSERGNEFVVELQANGDVELRGFELIAGKIRSRL